MPFTKDGYGMIVLALVVVVLCCTVYLLTNLNGFRWLSMIAVVLFLFVCYFFRDPHRTIPPGENRIVSPADGTIVAIKTVQEDTHFKAEVTQVSIFLSVFNVHVNRIPLSGKVRSYRYFPGKFLAAWNDKASMENEQTQILIEGGGIKIVMKQIAGFIARRIICRVSEGNDVVRGDRFGMIKFGSRVDLLLPKNVVIRVRLKDTVKGGESIIGEIQ